MKFELTKVQYLIQRDVLDQPADDCPGSRLSNIHLLHIKSISIWVLLGRDDTAYPQIKT